MVRLVDPTHDVQQSPACELPKTATTGCCGKPAVMSLGLDDDRTSFEHQRTSRSGSCSIRSLRP